MKVSLISTVFNEADNIIRFLDSIKSQSVMPDEIVVVDGGSSDNTVDLVSNFKGLNVKLFVKKGFNISKGRNFAIKMCRNDFIFCVDAGCILDKNWVKLMIEGFKTGADVVGGNFKPLTESSFQKVLGSIIVHDISSFGDSWIPSSRSEGFKKSVWKKVGGFPEELDIGEDLLFHYNLKKAGFKFAPCPTAIVSWNLRSSFRRMVKQFFNYGVGDGRHNILLKLFDSPNMNVYRHSIVIIGGFCLVLSLLFLPLSVIPFFFVSSAGILYTSFLTFKSFKRTNSLLSFIYGPPIIIFKTLSFFAGYLWGLFGGRWVR